MEPSDPDDLPIAPGRRPDQRLARSAPRAAPPTFLLDDEPVEVVPEPPRARLGAWLWRSATVYVLLYCLLFPLDRIPWSAPAAEGWDSGKQQTIVWLAHAIADTEITPPGEDNGSGDTSYHWFEVLFFAVAALLVGGLWHGLRRHREPGPRARDAVRTYVRWFLAVTMLGYGLAKVIPVQFGALESGQLAATYGQSSPMNLLWTFMAFSPAYTIFVGSCEVLGGLLLLSRSTATLGALVSAGVMANVVMLNFCYDVPVKLYSSHLFLMAVALCWRDARRLLDVLVRNRSAAPVALWPWSPSPWLRWPLRLLGVAFIGWVLYEGVGQNLDRWVRRGAPSGPLGGTWNVAGFTRDGVEVPAFTSPDRWRRLEILARAGVASVVLADGRQTWFRCEVDESKQELKLFGIAGPETQAPEPVVFRYSAADPVHPTLEGSMEDAKLQIELDRLEPSSFPLVERGFHWVNEWPLNKR